jgi:hypothetical protein
MGWLKSLLCCIQQPFTTYFGTTASSSLAIELSGGCGFQAAIPWQLAYLEEEFAVIVYSWLDLRGQAAATTSIRFLPNSSTPLVGVVFLIISFLVTGSAAGRGSGCRHHSGGHSRHQVHIFVVAVHFP